ncbi:endolytic transglycosylase MltG [Leptobacterium flavescens]|uniref:Endolytic murein transglycosylase n=1 Tax=Leptobacterium flavescens TaxID=472055 RepID=A0A6P0UJY6_9FLAO|nr:endolytic transglycosylase MltG [Leptobacterium flavescens]NER13287.1 endolytic transglycosylase MltG [Leptobacterium flavescens]
MYLRKILVVIAVLGILIGGFFVYRIYNAIFSPNTAFNNEKAYVLIPSDAGYEDIREQLLPLLKDMGSFDMVARKKGYADNFKAGRYALRPGMNNNEIINTLRSANQAINVTFNNQETLEKLAGRISKQIEADSTELITAFKDPQFLGESGFNEDTSLAMYLPNSYQLFWNTSGEEFRDRMLKEYGKFWNEDRKKKAAEIGLDETEVISLAAIVHEESKKIDERPRVAGVYLNRLKKNIPLQADPTVIFALKKHFGTQDTIIKRVLYKDLELDSPYNTYKNAGVPPGPISMPDISAIDAVLNAEKHEYLFFVADISNFGYHKFAKTNAQHNANKRQYIRWLDAQKIRR